jgi:gas vesicle protein
MNEFDITLDEPRAPATSLGAIAIAAAVGAGVALLVASDTGRDARRRLGSEIRRLELGSRAEEIGGAATDRWKQFRRERKPGRGGRRRGRRHGGSGRKVVFRETEAEAGSGALYAALGTVAGAAIAALLTPQGGRETREWIGQTFDDLRSNASLRWREHRARRRPAEEPELERLNGGAI